MAFSLTLVLLDTFRFFTFLFTFFQLGLMVSSLLGPATVVMIVQGAFQYVFSWSGTVSLIVSLIPVIIFIILCYTTSADTQVWLILFNVCNLNVSEFYFSQCMLQFSALGAGNAAASLSNFSWANLGKLR